MADSFLPGAAPLVYVPREVLLEIFHGAFQRVHGPWREGAIGLAGSEKTRVHLEQIQIGESAAACLQPFKNQ